MKSRFSRSIADNLNRLTYIMERNSSIAVLSFMVLLAFLQIIWRNIFNASIMGVSDYLQHGTLWLTFAGASLAAHRRRHLRLSTGFFLPRRFKKAVGVFHTAISLAVCIVFIIAGFQLVIIEWENPLVVAPWLPSWGVQLVMPVFIGIIAVRLFKNQADNWLVALFLCLAMVGAVCLGLIPEESRNFLVPIGIILLFMAVMSGAPLFILVGGAGLLLFFTDGIPVMAIPSEAYRMVSSPNLPTIPLFTLAGCILADGGASRRLVSLFKAIFGWMPGGIAIASAIVCAFFTTFTGASGVTIMALGAILLPILMKAQYGERFSLGLLTGSGSIGLLFPPALPIILYAVVAGIAIDRMFIAGIIPGFILLFLTGIYSIIVFRRKRIASIPFSGKNLLSAVSQAKWDIAIPVIVLLGLFTGFATVVETAALTVIYVLFVECFIHRELKFTKDLALTATRASILVGGIMIILGFAFGFTSYLVDADVPTTLLKWVRAAIESKIAFLLVLNLFLIVVGCIMDIFSAIVVIVPILIPIGAAFAIHPVHLGIIFLVNMELGYLTPPVGLNLFLAAFRFGKPLNQIYRPVLPFIILRIGVLFLVTFIPAISLWLVR